MKFEKEDPIELIRKENVTRNKPEKGVKVFYIAKYDPRMPHPRKLLSKNYHHIENHPVLSQLFPEYFTNGHKFVVPSAQFCFLLTLNKKC